MCPLLDEQVMQMIMKMNIHTVEYYSAIKENTTVSFSGKWVQLKVILAKDK